MLLKNFNSRFREYVENRDVDKLFELAYGFFEDHDGAVDWFNDNAVSKSQINWEWLSKVASLKSPENYLAKQKQFRQRDFENWHNQLSLDALVEEGFDTHLTGMEPDESSTVRRKFERPKRINPRPGDPSHQYIMETLEYVRAPRRLTPKTSVLWQLQQVSELTGVSLNVVRRVYNDDYRVR